MSNSDNLDDLRAEFQETTSRLDDAPKSERASSPPEGDGPTNADTEGDTAAGTAPDTAAGTADEPAPDASDRSLVEAIAAYREAIAAGEHTEHVGGRDPSISALFCALVNRPDDGATAAEGLQTELGLPTNPDVTKAALARMAIRVGLREAAPEAFEAWVEYERAQFEAQKAGSGL